jgi:hypothetical protein
MPNASLKCARENLFRRENINFINPRISSKRSPRKKSGGAVLSFPQVTPAIH